MEVKSNYPRKLIFFIVIVRRFFGAARHDFLLRFIKVFPDFPAEHAFPVHILFHYSAAYHAVRPLGKHKFLADVHRVVVNIFHVPRRASRDFRHKPHFIV